MNTTEHKSICYYLKQLCVCKAKNLWVWALLLLAFYFLTGKVTVKNYKDTSFDFLLFTQRWLPSACIAYVENPRKPFSRHCSLPTNFKTWAIHGLWPTENNHMGPFFCNRSMVFDINALEPIKSDLMTYWPNIEGDRDYTSLWSHEWEKHGTCAAQLESLNTEYKYFATTLGFLKKYNIENVFRKYNIVPSLSKGYYLSELFNILQSSLGKVPQIHCIFETHTNQPYLSEIRMCLDKGLNLIDCKESQYNFGRVSTLTNCPRDRLIIYPDTSTPPSITTENYEKDFHMQLLDLLHLIRFVQWVVL